MATWMPRGSQPIARPVASPPRPGAAPMPQMGPYPIVDALLIAYDHILRFPLHRYFRVVTRDQGIEVSIESDIVARIYWAKYSGTLIRALNYQELRLRDAQLLRDGVIDEAICDRAEWWIVPFPQLPDMATRMEE
jgi:hypothetical protein